ncbi:hypothetical protein PR003_g3145 [Phytophthora rubi]|uniref:Uncharacterized protein n=1 Tax=Phytophthora rubi TaxID=129364 RepID=A0A6A3NLR4_9STRA|nr:hypothetical protein PR002_g2914 [Phytophthora rubi]KAE9049875.1 hypothetical protein PR001_g2908 [Phytophthora rubi]KAE9354874.1 hypothetical protein PR003_g3145 [Phytophthora rubi]
MTDATTLTILKDALGDLSQYHSSGWFWHAVKDKGEWVALGKTQVYPCPGYRPNVNPRCYCNTPIKRHFLIIDKDENHHFVGSECVKLFGGHYKVCLGCQCR